MSKLSKLAHVMFGVCVVIPVTGYSADADVIADKPLFLEGNAKPNILFTLDDSGSMDSDVLFSNKNGALFYNVNTGFFSDAEGNYHTGFEEDVRDLVETNYIFPVDYNRSGYDGGRVYNEPVIPPVAAYAFTRASQYNRSYYNPSLTYQPWESLSIRTYSDSSPTNALFDANYPDGHSLDLRSTQRLSFAGFATYEFYPATFYVPLETGQFTLSDVAVDNVDAAASFDCTTTTAADYQRIYTDRKDQQLTSQDGVSALAPDGQCLQEVKITSLNESLINSISSRTAAEELQNFANWFTYHRRRHQSMRGAVAESVQGIAGLRVAPLWINEPATLVMTDLDTGGDAFFGEVYNHFNGWGGGGTPLRDAMVFAGNQFHTNTSVIQAECQKNYNIVFTDGLNTSTGTFRGLGNEDGDQGSPYADTEANSVTMADVAMRYYLGPLRASEPNFSLGQVRLPDACYKQEGDPGYSPYTDTLAEATDPSYAQNAMRADCNANLHLNTYAVGFGPDGKHFVGNGYNAVADAYDTPPDWDSMNVLSEDGTQIDDLFHAALNGRGQYYRATDVGKMQASLQAAMREIVRATGSATNVTFNTATLEEGSNVYTASFNSGDWSGSVAARSLNSVTGAIGSVIWDAATVLNSQSPDSRFIVAYNDTNRSGVLFNWASLSAAAIDDLDGATNDAQLGQSRLNYLRGNRAGEGSVFRTRSTVLGDVVNSSPVYAGVPASAWPDRDPFGAPDVLNPDGTYTDTGRYSGFKLRNSERTPIVYVGANDGMLHGFNAETGVEVMAYIPSFVYSSQAGEGLNYLTEPGYEHRYYVDLTPAVSDVFIGDASGQNDAWKTILLGGSRDGGRGVFALDVTDPSAFENTDAAASALSLWEFQHADLGYLIDAPLVGLVKWGRNDYRWSALIPNGYESDNGKTGMFVLDIEGGQNGWEANAGTDWVFIELAASGSSGLSPLRAVDFQDEDGNPVQDGVIDRVYAGDQSGNAWAISLVDGIGSWGSAYTVSGVAAPLFVAQDAAGGAQPITSAPVMGRNIYNTAGSAPNLLAFFGTGQYLSENDPASAAVQSFYGVWDRGATVTRADLTTRTIAEFFDQGVETRKVSGDSIDWTADTAHGWVVDFDPAITGESGERVIRSPLIRGQYVLFTTITPQSDTCESGGTSWTMALRFDGITPDREVFDVNNDGSVDSQDGQVAGVRQGALVLNVNILGDNLYSQASDGTVDQDRINLSSGKTLGRSGWREIYQE